MKKSKRHDTSFVRARGLKALFALGFHSVFSLDLHYVQSKMMMTGSSSVLNAHIFLCCRVLRWFASKQSILYTRLLVLHILTGEPTLSASCSKKIYLSIYLASWRKIQSSRHDCGRWETLISIFPNFNVEQSNNPRLIQQINWFAAAHHAAVHCGPECVSCCKSDFHLIIDCRHTASSYFFFFISLMKNSDIRFPCSSPIWYSSSLPAELANYRLTEYIWRGERNQDSVLDLYNCNISPI